MGRIKVSLNLITVANGFGVLQKSSVCATLYSKNRFDRCLISVQLQLQGHNIVAVSRSHLLPFSATFLFPQFILFPAISRNFWHFLEISRISKLFATFHIRKLVHFDIASWYIFCFALTHPHARLAKPVYP